MFHRESILGDRFKKLKDAVDMHRALREAAQLGTSGTESPSILSVRMQPVTDTESVGGPEFFFWVEDAQLLEGLDAAHLQQDTIDLYLALNGRVNPVDGPPPLLSPTVW